MSRSKARKSYQAIHLLAIFMNFYMPEANTCVEEQKLP